MNRLINHFASQGSPLGFFAGSHHSRILAMQAKYLVYYCYGKKKPAEAGSAILVYKV
jgi:hypothetical protein